MDYYDLVKSMTDYDFDEGEVIRVTSAFVNPGDLNRLLCLVNRFEEQDEHVVERAREILVDTWNRLNPSDKFSSGDVDSDFVNILCSY